VTRRDTFILIPAAAVGLALAAAFVHWSRPSPPNFRLLSDCDGPVEQLVIQYLPEADPIVLPIYRQFIAALPKQVEVIVMCPAATDFEQFAAAMPDHACTLRPVITGHDMTAWSRDRWLALGHGNRPVTLLAPRGEDGADAWPARAGDEQVAFDLARSLVDVFAHRSDLWFDGGDFVADRHTVFVAGRMIERNVNRTVADTDELVAELKQWLGRRVVLLHDAPPYHAGMYMMPIGRRRMLVGDPSLIEPSTMGHSDVPWDRTAATQAQFDSVARACEQAGYTVTRIGVAISTDGRTYLTPLNVILDARGEQPTVYMPVFDQQDHLNQHAGDTWRAAGYRVVPINCTTSYRHFGSLRCLVNVIRRGPTTAG
jgi:hypothetical protein